MKEDIRQSISKVSHIHSEVAAFLAQKLSSRGLPELISSHGNILFQLSINESLTMGELAKKINRDKSTTTVLVRKLEKAGLISEKTAEKDKRNKIISLTEKGCEYNKITSNISDDLIQTFYKDFTPQEQEQFFNFLIRIEKNFE